MKVNVSSSHVVNMINKQVTDIYNAWETREHSVSGNTKGPTNVSLNMRKPSTWIVFLMEPKCIALLMYVWSCDFANTESMSCHDDMYLR